MCILRPREGFVIRKSFLVCIFATCACLLLAGCGGEEPTGKKSQGGGTAGEGGTGGIDGSGGTGGVDGTGGTGGTGGAGGVGGTGGEGATGGEGGDGGTGGVGGDEPTTGSLRVRFHATDDGQTASVTLYGPDAFQELVLEDSLLEDLAPGLYLAEGETVEVDGNPHFPIFSGAPAEVRAGETSTIEVTYEPAPLALRASPIVVPLTGEAEVEVELLRAPDFSDEVEVSVAVPLGSSLQVRSPPVILAEGETRASFVIGTGAVVRSLDQPLFLGLHAQSGSTFGYGEVEARIAALVTNANDDGPGSLREEIRAATAIASHPKIRFRQDEFAGSTVIRLASPLVIEKAMDLEGFQDEGIPRITLEAEGDHRLVEVVDGTVRLATLGLRGGKASVGGCIWNNATLRLEHVRMEGCSATRGGALANQAFLEIVGGVFTDNDAVTEGGAIHSTASLLVEETDFHANAAKRGGGIALVAAAQRRLEIVGGGFFENQAEHGGAVYTEGPVDGSISATLLSANHGSAGGGGLYSEGAATWAVIGAQFVMNSTSGAGGGVHLGPGATANFSGSGMRMEANLATHGGAIFNVGEVEFLEGILRANEATSGNGGAILNIGKLTLDEARLWENEASGNGGAIFHGTPLGSLSIENSHFRQNKSTEQGGALYLVTTSTGSVGEGTQFESNEAEKGGAVALAAGATLTVTHSAIHENEAQGGAIHNEGTLELASCLFEANEGEVGGAILNEEDAMLTVRSSSFVANKGDIGGAVANFGDFDLYQSTFAGNVGHLMGGGIHTMTGSLRSSFSTFLGNSTGIVVSSGSMTVKGNVLAKNGNTDLRTVTNLLSLGHNLLGVVDPSVSDRIGPTDQGGTAAAPLDPLLGPLGENGGPTPTAVPLDGSPARDQVPANDCMDLDGVSLSTDQRGRPRPQGGACDRGAVEAP